MSYPKVTIAIPTLAAGANLVDCLESLAQQSRRDFEVVVVDNSGQGLVRAGDAARYGIRVIEPGRNIGFGPAINEVVRSSTAPFIATINDDATAHPDWLCSLMEAMEARTDAGSCASQVRLFGLDQLDSAGLLISGDGSSKQRGHGAPPAAFGAAGEVLCPSGSAAIYRRAMLDEVGLFDDRFFLYCEDTDLGLRAQWAGWKCLYVPEAIVEHRYSQTAGRSSAFKAYYVERNRLLVAFKNFPAAALVRVPGYGAARYFWHFVTALQGKGSAGRFRSGGGLLELGYLAARAHLVLAGSLPRLLRQRRAVRSRARVGPAEFRRILAAYAIAPREVAVQ